MVRPCSIDEGVSACAKTAWIWKMIFLCSNAGFPPTANPCRVNGVPVSVSQLRSLGSLLLDIHGQNDGRQLMDETRHRDYLDRFGGCPAGWRNIGRFMSDTGPRPK